MSESRITSMLVAWSVGGFVRAQLGALAVLGKLEIYGERRAARYLRRGKAIIVANHPDGFTPFGIPAIFWKIYRSNPDRCIWNMPKRGLVPKPFLKAFRCIEFDQSDKRRMLEAFRQTGTVLELGHNMLLFAEGHRTVDPENTGVMFERSGERVMRRLHGSPIPGIAERSGAYILPVWIDMPEVTQKMRYWRSVAHPFRGEGRVLRIYFGEPYRVEKGFDSRREVERLQNAILNADAAR